MTALRNLLAGTAMSLALVACASGGNEPIVGSAAGSSPTEVVVTNRNWADVTVYAVRSSMRQRLGTVTSMSTERFKLPRHLVSGGSSPLRLLADPIGSTRTYTSDAVTVWPGEQMEFTIENLITTSSLTVWNR